MVLWRISATTTRNAIFFVPEVPRVPRGSGFSDARWLATLVEQASGDSRAFLHIVKRAVPGLRDRLCAGMGGAHDSMTLWERYERIRGHIVWTSDALEEHVAAHAHAQVCALGGFTARGFRAWYSSFCHVSQAWCPARKVTVFARRSWPSHARLEEIVALARANARDVENELLSEVFRSRCGLSVLDAKGWLPARWDVPQPAQPDGNDARSTRSVVMNWFERLHIPPN